MPSHTVPSSLISFYIDADGAPWNYARWQTITGMPHGLFPEDRGLLHKDLRPEDVDEIRSYFNQYSKLPSEDAKIRFTVQAKNAVLPGRSKWRTFINKNWPKWNVHAIITEILRENDVHPLTLAVQNPDYKGAPPSKYQIPKVMDPVGVALFGEEVLLPTGALPLVVGESTAHLIQRTWIILCRQIGRNRTRLDFLEHAARDAFNDLDREKPTKGKLNTVIRSVARWRALAELFQTPSTIALIEEMDEELKRLMAAIGSRSIKPKANRKSKGLCKTSDQALASLASDKDIADVINAYLDFFGLNTLSDTGAIIEPDRIPVPFGEPVNGADAGVENEANMTTEELARNLGFDEENPLPILFNRHRHRAGLTPWSGDHPDCLDPLGPHKDDIDPIRLHWHQLTAVHAIVRKLLIEDSVKGCYGILLADEVGLGKTFVAATMIALLSDIGIRQELNLPSLPMLSMTSVPPSPVFFPMPLLPHLILVPGTLINQWVGELKAVLKPGNFDIFVYGSGLDAHEAFWDPSGPFRSSKHSINRIIIASHTDLYKDFGLLYFPRNHSSRKELPWSTPNKQPTFDQTVVKTLFGQKYVSVTVDEAHEFRNSGVKHIAALELLKLTVVKLIATATPLLTSNTDTAAMGRLVGLPHFFTKEALAEERADAAELRRAKKEMPVDQDADIADDDNPVKRCQVEISLRHHAHFQGRVIRRTGASKRWDGSVLIQIPPYQSILAFLELTEREMNIISALTDSVKDSASSATGNPKICTRSFYIESRTAVGYAVEGDRKDIPQFHSLEEWAERKSTKMDVLARICQHTLSSDRAPPVQFSNGQAFFPQIPPLKPGERDTKAIKIAIYQEFPSLGRVLHNVLSLYGIKYLFINGEATYSQRSRIIQTFRTDPECRVLIFSSVGSVGLNLSMASVMIFLDQPWSAQDERQIIGRVHRQPQKRTVLVYHLLALDTADIILSSQARGKRDMMDAFLSKEKGKELFALFSGASIPHADDPARV